MTSTTTSSPIKSPGTTRKNGKSGRNNLVTLVPFLLLAAAYFNNKRSMDFYDSLLTHDHHKSTTTKKVQQNHHHHYIPSRLEKQIMEVSRSVLHYDQDMAYECDLYLNQSSSSQKEFYSEYHRYLAMLDKFALATKSFQLNNGNDVDVDDLRLLSTQTRKQMCQKIDQVLHGSFRDAKTDCSWTNSAGYVEPLLPPLRHPRICQKGKKGKFKLNIGYLVHDFGKICQELDDPGVRTVFLDLGASLEFHPHGKNPALSLVKLYNKFGIKFDHYYAFEYTFIPPEKVYKKVPEELLEAYHWYNVPVESSPSSKQNPWKAILSKFTPKDLVVIKLDIDTASVEIPLVQELLQTKYAPLVDHVYFEHHVRMKEMFKNWGEHGANGTLQDSLDLFTSLREAGIGAHSWV